MLAGDGIWATYLESKDLWNQQNHLLVLVSLLELCDKRQSRNDQTKRIVLHDEMSEK